MPLKPIAVDPVPDSARKNIDAIRELEAAMAERRSRIERLTDAVSGFVGSFQFLITQAVLFLAWVGINLALAPSGQAFDPFPFEFLNFLVGAEAILLSTFVLMTQNRQSKEADHWGHLQLQVSMLAEQEATKMLQMLQQICARLGMEKAAGDRELKDMIQTTHVEEIATELEKARVIEESPPEEDPPPVAG